MRISLKLASVCLSVATAIATATPATAMRASWYGVGDGSGTHTASGQRFNPHALGAAHKTLPFGTKILISYRGKSVCVPVTDRGPFVKGRELDVTYGVAKRLGMINAGVVNLRTKVNGC